MLYKMYIDHYDFLGYKMLYIDGKTQDCDIAKIVIETVIMAM